MQDQAKLPELEACGRFRLPMPMCQAGWAGAIADNNLCFGGADDQARAKAEIMYAVQHEPKACRRERDNTLADTSDKSHWPDPSCMPDIKAQVV